MAVGATHRHFEHLATPSQQRRLPTEGRGRSVAVRTTRSRGGRGHRSRPGSPGPQRRLEHHQVEEDGEPGESDGGDRMRPWRPHQIGEFLIGDSGYPAGSQLAGGAQPHRERLGDRHHQHRGDGQHHQRRPVPALGEEVGANGGHPDPRTDDPGQRQVHGRGGASRKVEQRLQPASVALATRRIDQRDGCPMHRHEPHRRGDVEQLDPLVRHGGTLAVRSLAETPEVITMAGRGPPPESGAGSRPRWRRSAGRTRRRREAPTAPRSPGRHRGRPSPG